MRRLSSSACGAPARRNSAGDRRHAAARSAKAGQLRERRLRRRRASSAACFGFFAAPGTQRNLHSHIAGVLARTRGPQRRLRAEAAPAGVGAGARAPAAVSWTFDPLIRRNAWFNLGKLAADADGYLPNFYGSMDDAINRSDDTDRVLVLVVADHRRRCRPRAPAPRGATTARPSAGPAPRSRCEPSTTSRRSAATTRARAHGAGRRATATSRRCASTTRGPRPRGASPCGRRWAGCCRGGLRTRVRPRRLVRRRSRARHRPETEGRGTP